MRAAVTETGRAHGMLVIVNSFAGESSDTKRLAQLVANAHPGVAVLQLASEVVRNSKRLRTYERELARVERASKPYVIFATSVVEMGITFPTLDYVVTMDSGYEQETIGESTFPVVAPLGVNALLQRIGRVGRKRPGIAYISREVEASYSDLSDGDLNGSQALACEPIRFPLATASLLPLAYYACKHGYETSEAEQFLYGLWPPSGIALKEERVEELARQMQVLIDMELAYDFGGLSGLGESMERWIGQADVAYATKLQYGVHFRRPLAETMFWLVATALSGVPIRLLRAKDDYFVDHEGMHTELPHRIDVWSHELEREDLSVWRMFCMAAATYPELLFGKPDKTTESEWFEFEKWCNRAGIEWRRLLDATKAVRETWKLFCRVNSGHEHFQQLFGSPKAVQLEAFAWQKLYKELVLEDVRFELIWLNGTAEILFLSNENGVYSWFEHHNTDVEGTIAQDDTPLLLAGRSKMYARLVPHRKEKDGEVTWQVTHLSR